MPAFKVGRRHLFVAVWKHGVSMYGWRQGQNAGFTARHPELRTSNGSFQLQPDVAENISDEEFREFLGVALDT